jgi:hypothetical protein
MSITNVRALVTALILLVCGMLGSFSPALADSLTVQGQNSVGIYDTKLYQNYNDINFGGSATLTIFNSSGLNRLTLFKFTNIDTIGTGQVIDSLKIQLYCTAESDATVGMLEVFKPWFEGNSDNATENGAADDNHWFHPDSSWGAEMLGNTSDAGTQNRNSGSGADRTATAMDTESVTTANTWYTFWVSAALARDWYDGDKEPFGVAFIETSMAGTTVFASSENATTANRPKVTIYYHSSGTVSANRRAAVLRNNL